MSPKALTGRSGKACLALSATRLHAAAALLGSITTSAWINTYPRKQGQATSRMALQERQAALNSLTESSDHHHPTRPIQEGTTGIAQRTGNGDRSRYPINAVAERSGYRLFANLSLEAVTTPACDFVDGLHKKLMHRSYARRTSTLRTIIQRYNRLSLLTSQPSVPCSPSK